MKLTFEGIKDTAAWQSAGVKLPEYDVQAAAEKAKAHPVWAHFGAGNIFRIFVGGLADTLIAKGEMDRGITCVETFDFDVVDQIYTPYDNLVLAVTLNADATTDKRVLGSLSEAIKAQSGVPEAWSRLKAVFADPEPANGFLHHHGEGLRAQKRRRSVLPVRAGGYRQRPGQGDRRDGDCLRHAAAPL